jgi:lipoteichoic acid synthase
MKKNYGVKIDNKYKIFSIFFFLSIMIKGTIMQLMSNISVLPLFSSENLMMLLRNALILIILISFLYIVFYKKFREMLIAANILLTFIIVADVLYLRYYYAPLTLSLLPLLKYAGTVRDSIKSLFTFGELFYIIDIPVFVFFLIRNIKGEKTVFYRNKRTLRKFIISFTALVLVFVLSLVITSAKKYTDLISNDNYTIRKSGVLFYHYSDIKEFISASSKTVPATNEELETVKSFFESRINTDKKSYGLCKGKNLIIVQLEAIESFLINRRVEGKEITPNLNRFLVESLYFDNIYHQVAGGNTSDAEFLINNSLYPARKGVAYYKYPDNKYYSLPYYLNQKDYNTYSLHANDLNYWNRQNMYKSVGFDKYLSDADFNIDEVLGWGLTDSSMFRQSFELLDTDKPFYSFYITLSSHYPFDFFSDTREINTGEYENTLLGNYIKAANYADRAFGEFIESLEEKGLYDNSLIIAYGDHSAIPRNKSDGKSKFTDTNYNDFTWIKDQKIPLLIHSPDLKPDINSTVGGQIDIFPTIANLMGFDAEYALGKDLLNTESGYMVKRNRDIVTDDFVFINLTGKVYNKEGLIITDNRYDEKIKTMQNELLISDLILEKNILKELR